MSVVTLALIAGVVSYGHIYELALNAGEGPLTATLIPFSVDGMIVASSMSLLVDSRSGRPGGALPWTLLILGSAASLAANVAAAIPTVEGRLIAAWPSFALMGAYELLMRQVRHSAGHRSHGRRGRADAATAEELDRTKSLHRDADVAPELPPSAAAGGEVAAGAERRQQPVAITRSRGRMRPDSRCLVAAADLHRRACAWVEANRAVDGALPTGRQIGDRFGRSDRWGRLIRRDVSQAVSVAAGASDGDPAYSR